MEQREFQTILSPQASHNGEKKSASSSSSFSGIFWLIIFFLIVLGGYMYYRFLISAPSRFSPNTFVLIPEGASLGEIAKLLEKDQVIRSAFLFNIAVAQLGKEKSVTSGMYLFKDPSDVYSIAKRMGSGDHGIETKKITLPEGYTIADMANIFDRELPNFDRKQFIQDAKKKEGYLFPDTYFFLSTATSGPALEALSENFIKKTAALRDEANGKKQNWSDLVIMGSLLEGEARTPEDRRIVSQILWKRISIGMRLGVDAPFFYILGKGSLELTQSDLASDTPYNTYRYSGLPPTPINNPGVDAIAAAEHPATTTYLYYLSDKKGIMHYAKTFEEHKLNKTKFLY